MIPTINEIVSSGPSLQKSSHQKGMTFKTGDVFHGTVIRRYPGGEFLVSAGGRQFRASTALNLMVGQKHTFQVRTPWPRIELKVLDGDLAKGLSPVQMWASSRRGRNRLVRILQDLVQAHNLKGLNPEARPAFKALSGLLPAMIYREPEMDGAKWLTRYLLGSGLFWENKLACHLLGEKNRPWNRILGEDLKGLLLSLERGLAVNGPEGRQLESLAMRITEALHLIEQDQFLNLSSLREGVGWFLFLPGLEENGFNRAEVFVEKRNQEEGIHFSMLLEFSHLGPVEADVFVTDPTIGVRIFVDDEEKAAFVTGHLPLLEGALQKVGMRAGPLFCGVKEKGDLDMNPFGDGKWEAPCIHLVI